jgi:ABC-2 type transport system ATP-binding protein
MTESSYTSTAGPPGSGSPSSSGSSTSSGSAAPTDREPVLSGRDLKKTFGENVAVDGVSLSVSAGELYGLVGPDGAGKTTIIRMMVGLMDPDEGEARVLGEPAVEGGEAREAIGYMPQLYSLYGDLSVDENLSFFARLFGLPKKEFRKRRERLLSITRLARFSDRRAEALSGGMYKKLALACALLHQPRVLLLDEPTNGVDPVSRRELWELLYEFVSEGMGVLVTTPYMDEAEKCHRVGLIHRGTMLAEGQPAHLIDQFEDRVLVVHHPDRERLELALDERADVLGVAPRGSSLKVLVREADESSLRRWLEQEVGEHEVERAHPNFEDVFLTRIAGETHPAPGDGGDGGEPHGGEEA